MEKSDPGSDKKTKSKPVSKLSHDLFGMSYEEEDSAGDLFSPQDTAKDLATATPTVKSVTKESSKEKKNPLLDKGGQ